MSRTKYLPVKYRDLVAGKFPNAGPYPYIRAMKKKYYGLDSFCVRCGTYIYRLGTKLTKETETIWRLAT